MSSLHKIKQSRTRWKQKAQSRADNTRYLRKELQRVKRARDHYKQRAAQAQAQLKAQRHQPQLPAIHSKVALVFLALELFLLARIGFRAVCRVLAVVAPQVGLAKAPCPQTISNWVGRLSLARLHSAPGLPRSPLSADPFANGCIWMIDISIAWGAGKLLAVVALDARHHQFNPGAPSLEQVRCLLVAVADSWTGEAIADLLHRLRGSLGRPVAFLKDGGAELAKATDLLAERNCRSFRLEDVSHVVANLLKHHYTQHPLFETFLSACGKVSSHLKQSALACLAPPKTSTTARFMNLHRLVTWADQLLNHSPPGRAARGSALSQLRAALEQLPACKAFLSHFRRDASALLHCQQRLKVHGLTHDTSQQCKELLDALPPFSPVRLGFLKWLDTHLEIASRLGLAQIGLPISSDPIESLFGVAKQHGQGQIKDANRIALHLPALCGPLTKDDARRVLEVSVAQQQAVLGSLSSLTKQRRQVLPHPGRLESLRDGDNTHHLVLLAGAKNRSKSAVISQLSTPYALSPGARLEDDTAPALPRSSPCSKTAMVG
jgi:hypothetical protein